VVPGLSGAGAEESVQGRRGGPWPVGSRRRGVGPGPSGWSLARAVAPHLPEESGRWVGLGQRRREVMGRFVRVQCVPNLAAVRRLDSSSSARPWPVTANRTVQYRCWQLTCKRTSNAFVAWGNTSVCSSGPCSLTSGECGCASIQAPTSLTQGLGCCLLCMSSMNVRCNTWRLAMCFGALAPLRGTGSLEVEKGLTWVWVPV